MPAPASPPVRCSPGNPPPRTPTPRPRSKSAGTSRKSTPGSWRPPFPPPPAPQPPTGARALPCCAQPAAAGRPSPRTRSRMEGPAEPREVPRPVLPSTCPAAALVVQRAMMGAAAAEQIRSPSRSEPPPYSRLRKGSATRLTVQMTNSPQQQEQQEWNGTRSLDHHHHAPQPSRSSHSPGRTAAALALRLSLRCLLPSMNLLRLHRNPSCS